MKNAVGIALWVMFLALPLLAVRVNTLNNELEWRWEKLAWLGVAALVLALVWQLVVRVRERRHRRQIAPSDAAGRVGRASLQTLLDDRVLCRRLLTGAALLAGVFPWLVSTAQNFYHVNVMVS